MLSVAAQGLPRRDAAAAGERPQPLADYERIPAIVRWSFIVFAGAMPLEAVNFSIGSSVFSLARLSGLLFIVAFLFFYNPLSGKRSFPPGSSALSWFLVYFAVFALNGIFLDGFYFRQFVSILLTLAQLLLLFWISSSLLGVEALTRRALLAFAFGAVLCAVGTLLRLPGFAHVIESQVGDRVTAMEFNPNYLAYTMAVAAIILIASALEMKIRGAWKKWFLIALVLPLLAIMVRTGSRTGLVVFAIGLFAYMVAGGGSGRRLILLCVSTFIVAALVYLVAQHPTVLTRFEESYSGNLAGRQEIIPASIDMIVQKPVFGWQPVVYWEELGRRLGHIWGVKDAHNLFIHLLLEVGLVGAVPFIIGLGLCLAGAWKARLGKFGILPLVLLLMTLSANLTHTYLARKPQWLILAFAVAAAATLKRRVETRYLVRVPIRSRGRAAGHLLNPHVRQKQF